MSAVEQRGLGFVREPPDSRDLLWSSVVAALPPLPRACRIQAEWDAWKAVDLRGSP